MPSDRQVNAWIVRVLAGRDDPHRLVAYLCWHEKASKEQVWQRFVRAAPKTTREQFERVWKDAKLPVL